MKLSKLLTFSAAALMLLGVGAGSSNAINVNASGKVASLAELRKTKTFNRLTPAQKAQNQSLEHRDKTENKPDVAAIRNSHNNHKAVKHLKKRANAKRHTINRKRHAKKQAHKHAKRQSLQQQINSLKRQLRKIESQIRNLERR